ncbi:glutathione peroxidase [Sporosarcina limicola]|uniref:Glutathione peroxidase n=1 Tax=Sporosarcina limicola TaxID=34101 RepID=A0A927MLX6_9BACL|nr:glutathione peroxidase [Sporosarcina limicola]MBE1557164.1 glutathione peroxidase [Sporosarcina limicola]
MKIIYDFIVKKANGETQSLEEYKGKPLIIVNTASKCGFVTQFKELQDLYTEYIGSDLVILGFPSDNFNDQEFDDIEKTMEFCQLNYGVTFPMFAKVDVKGDTAEPLFAFLTSKKKGMLTEGIKWNFTKFLIDREGNVMERFAPQTSPLKMKKKIDEIVQ